MVKGPHRGVNNMRCLEAHARAGMNPAAKGRYIVEADQSNGVLEVGDLVWSIYQNSKVLSR